MMLVIFLVAAFHNAEAGMNNMDNVNCMDSTDYMEYMDYIENMDYIDIITSMISY